jgi:hypothetical protein
VAEELVDTLDDPLGDGVLELLGLAVHLAPVEPDDLHQEELDQPVAAQHVGGQLAAGRGEPHAAVGLVAHQAAVGQGLDHRRHRAGGDAETGRDLPHRHQRSGLPVLLEQDALEVILDRAGGHAGSLSRGMPRPAV